MAIRTRTGSLLWLQGLGCGTAIAVAPAASLLVAILMGPAVAAIMLDRTPQKPMARPTLLLSGATVIAPVYRLLSGSNTIGAAIGIAADPSQLALSWLSAAAGWTIAEIVTLTSFAIAATIIRNRAAALAQERQNLLDEWGTSLTG